MRDPIAQHAVKAQETESIPGAAFHHTKSQNFDDKQKQYRD